MRAGGRLGRRRSPTSRPIAARAARSSASSAARADSRSTPRARATSDWESRITPSRRCSVPSRRSPWFRDSSSCPPDYRRPTTRRKSLGHLSLLSFRTWRGRTAATRPGRHRSPPTTIRGPWRGPQTSPRYGENPTASLTHVSCRRSTQRVSGRISGTLGQLCVAQARSLARVGAPFARLGRARHLSASGPRR